MPAPDPRRRLLLLFVLGALGRVGAWLAGPDRNAAFAAGYQGDAPVWARLVGASPGEPELALPFRPPGMTWLSRLLTDGDSFLLARAVMALLGAAIAPLVYLVLRRGFAERVAFVAGTICALGSNLVLLSGGLHSETPYLLLFLLSMLDYDRLREGRLGAAARFGALQAAASLFRADHLAFVALLAGWLAWRERRRAALPLLVTAAAMVVVLLPWQLHATKAIAQANTAGFATSPPAPLPLPGALPWTAAAMQELAAMPAFARTMAFRFVDDTVRARGGRRVDAADVDVLLEAYGARPEPLRTPLVALYGPLNFFLANGPESTGGFTRRALDREPPLAGGPARYPRGLAAALRDIRQLTFEYPPHLHAINHGYRLGLDWVLSNPGAALVLVGKKLALAWRGAATGLGGYALPIGASGVREPVDLVTPVGGLAGAWRTLLLALTAIGLWRARHHAGAAPWLCWLAAKLAVVALFFGYARLGALCIPSLALLWALALDAGCNTLPESWRRRAATGLLVILAGLELARCGFGIRPELRFESAPDTDAVHARAWLDFR